MIHLKKYQDEAVNNLSKTFYKLLNKPGARHNLVFKAPTGAGKTVMMASLLNKVAEEIGERTELEKRNIAYIWIAPNKLYIQSYNAIKGFFAEMRSIKPIFFEDISGDALLPNEVLFVNWESINKEKNTMVRENETNKTLYSYINRARLNDTEIVVIIDEEHMFSGKAAKRAAEVLHKIYPKVDLRVSATPITNSDYKVIVERQEVVDEEMIKEGIILNPALDLIVQEGRGIEEILLEQALTKRNELKATYEELGLNINPLLLIQLPNDSSDSNTADDQKYIEIILQNLEHKYGIHVKNNRLAVWLSGRKDNVDDIEKPDNMVEVLLFKQAIALGWDCPRAAVLLIFRELKSTSFTIQTVGRILRMPEQKHYPKAELNQGYVYTNLSKDKIEIVRDDMSYITMNKARRKSGYKEVVLNSTYINTRIVRNRLGSKFRPAMFQVAERIWNVSKDLSSGDIFLENRQKLIENFLDLNVDKIEVIIPENVNLSGELETKMVVETARFAKTQGELNQLFRLFCRANVGAFAPVDSTPVLEIAIKLFFEEYLGFSEMDAVKITLYNQNQPKIIELIEQSVIRYEEIQQEKADKSTKDIQKYTWEVPTERIYNELYEERETETHALEPFYEYVRASKPEIAFANYLESNKSKLEWWYKNGEKAKEHFAVQYIDYMGKESLFYVDFVILTKNQTTLLFDTKTAGSDPSNAHLKHNALLDFMEERSAKGKNTIGGIIIPKETNGNLLWYFCPNRIENTKDTKGWEMLDLNKL